METEGYRHAYNDTQNPVEIIRTDMINNCPDFILTEAFSWIQSKSNFIPFR